MIAITTRSSISVNPVILWQFGFTQFGRRKHKQEQVSGSTIDTKFILIFFPSAGWPRKSNCPWPSVARAISSAGVVSARKRAANGDVCADDSTHGQSSSVGNDGK